VLRGLVVVVGWVVMVVDCCGDVFRFKRFKL
jgi:hypothetical protein